MEITSFSTSKLKSSSDDFIKYDIDVSLDEVENTESGIKLKFKFIFLSNPTNTKISLEGFASIFGNESEVSKYLQPDQKNIPVVVNTIYQDIFPLFYIISKSMNIPCPAYRLSQMSQATHSEIKQYETNASEHTDDGLTDKVESIQEEIKDGKDTSSDLNDIVEEANVSSV